MKSKDIKAMLIASKQKNESDYNEFLLIQEWAKKESGKKIDGWMAKRLPDGWKINWRAGMAHIEMPSGNSHLISYGENINPEMMPKYDSWADAGARERIEKIDAFLNDGDAFTEMAEKYLKAASLFNELQEVIGKIGVSSHRNPIHYEIVKAAGFPDNIFSDIYYKRPKTN